jgi:hypothetical protein
MTAVTFDEPTHTYHVDGAELPSVTRILRAVGLSTDWATLTPDVRAAAERKRELGTRVHRACVALDSGTLSWGQLEEDVFGYVEAWEKYVRERQLIEWLAIEQPFAHGALRYAGTLDRLGRTTANVYVLPDIKCGDPDDAAGQYQTAGYALLAEDAGLPPNISARHVQRECVQLSPIGTYALSPYPDFRHDSSVFKAALTVYSALPRRSRR